MWRNGSSYASLKGCLISLCICKSILVNFVRVQIHDTSVVAAAYIYTIIANNLQRILSLLY